MRDGPGQGSSIKAGKRRAFVSIDELNKKHETGNITVLADADAYSIVRACYDITRSFTLSLVHLLTHRTVFTFERSAVW